MPRPLAALVAIAPQLALAAAALTARPAAGDPMMYVVDDTWPAELHLTVDPTQTRQTITGWGASGAWWSQVLGTWPDARIDQAVDWLYGPEGAHLTAYRFNVGAGAGDEIIYPMRRTQTFETAPGVYDWTRDAASVRVLRRVVDAGVTDISFFTCSPPARLTATGTVSGGPNGGTNFKPGSEPEFAAYLLDIAEHWRVTLGLDTITLSPVNEPQWNWGVNHEGDTWRAQEGTHLEPDEVARVVSAVAAEIDARDAPFKLEAFDSGQWGGRTTEYLDALRADPVAWAGLDVLSVHSYYSHPQDKRALRAYLDDHGIDLPLAMSEWCQLQSGRDHGMDTALVLAQTVWEDVVLGGVQSWTYWTGVTPYQYNDGLIYANYEATRDLAPSKRLWVLGNYSRFVRPGATRLDLELTEHSEVSASAYATPTRDAVIVVVVNHHRHGALLYDAVPGHALAEAWVTDETRDLARVPADADELSWDDDTKAAHVMIPPRSVTTLIYRPADAPTEN